MSTQNKATTEHSGLFRPATLIVAAVLLVGLGLWFVRERVQASTSKSSDGPRAELRQAEAKPERQVIRQRWDARDAEVIIGTEKQYLTPNVRGEFPRILVPASTVITARVAFPTAGVGERITLQAEDGGQLVGECAGGSAMVDEQNQLLVSYKTSSNEGMHRVTMRRGAEQKVLDYWVGPEAPVHVRK